MIGRELMRTKAIAYFSILLIALLVGVVLLCGGYSEQEQITENETRAQPLILALESYRDAYGSYPDSLEQLTPTFITEIPVTVYDEPYSFVNYTYGQDDPDAFFEIGFTVHRTLGATPMGCGYQSRFGGFWECGSGHRPNRP